MDASGFQAAVDSWHDFYLAAGSASAALLGLLFVGVSINLASITASERVDLRARANLAFSNLLYLLCISLVVLIPGVDAGSLAASFAAIAIVGLLRIGLTIASLVRGRNRSWRQFTTLRRFSWTTTADLVLLYVAASIASRGDAIPLYAATFVVFVLLVGAADVAWGLLGVESREARHN